MSSIAYVITRPSSAESVLQLYSRPPPRFPSAIPQARLATDVTLTMAGLISPRPVSYMQHNLQYNPYQRNVSAYSDSPANVGPPLAIHTPNQALSAYPDGSPAASMAAAHEEQKIYNLVIELLDPVAREAALLELSKKREQYDDLALVLWHAFGASPHVLEHKPLNLRIFVYDGGRLGIMPALLQEIVSVYPLLSPPNLSAPVSNRVCNALALLQCVASHPDTRQLFLNGAETH